jgi:hypothetical protein
MGFNIKRTGDHGETNFINSQGCRGPAFTRRKRPPIERGLFSGPSALVGAPVPDTRARITPGGLLLGVADEDYVSVDMAANDG